MSDTDSNLVKPAIGEMKQAGLYDKDSDYRGMVGKAVEELVRTHAKQGHSGFSHSLCLHVFNKVVNYKTLSPLTNNPDEWMEVSHMCDGYICYQSRRQSSCFSYDGGKTYYDLDEKQGWRKYIPCWIKRKLPRKYWMKMHKADEKK